MRSEDSKIKIFNEVQRFRQIWLWGIIVLCSLSQMIGFYQYVRFGNIKNSPEGLFLLFFAAAFGMGLPILFLCMKLVTEIREDGIYIKFFPLHLSYRKILFKDLKNCIVRTYNPLREFGGWGIRYGTKCMAYTVSGNQGIQLDLNDGKKFLIGTNHAQELMEAISVYFQNK